MYGYWVVLEIEPTTELSKIKKAYAKKLKETDVQGNPEQFKILENAYQRAMSYAKNASINKIVLDESHKNKNIVSEDKEIEIGLNVVNQIENKQENIQEDYKLEINSEIISEKSIKPAYFEDKPKFEDMFADKGLPSGIFNDILGESPKNDSLSLDYKEKVRDFYRKNNINNAY